ncbi:MAG: hypothetical protein GY909_08390 [Oligoflexia bacterium]|nr:hypothetical protein [Oligoflexia bacterium]
MRNKKLIKIGSLIVIFLSAFSLQAMESHIPWLSIQGKSTEEAFINIVSNLKSHNLEDKTCYLEYSYRGASKKHPHYYSASTYTYADTEGNYALDMNLSLKLVQAVRRAINTNKIKLPATMSIKDYINFCDFRITGLNLWIGDTNLILRSSKHYNVKASYVLKEGTTHTGDYSFDLETEFILLEVSTTSEELSL